jgi:acyl carrier protein
VTNDVAPEEIGPAIREILQVNARLYMDVADLRDDDDLFRAGMTSHANVSVMLGLEDKFGVEFPDRLLRRSTFQSVSAIRSAVSELLAERDAE